MRGSALNSGYFAIDTVKLDVITTVKHCVNETEFTERVNVKTSVFVSVLSLHSCMLLLYKVYLTVVALNVYRGV